jgi:hypothetical protein
VGNHPPGKKFFRRVSSLSMAITFYTNSYAAVAACFPKPDLKGTDISKY